MLGRTPMNDDGARKDVEGHHGCFETHQATLGGKHLINNMIRDVEMHNKGIKKDIEHVKKT